MITFTEYLRLREFDLKPAVHYKPGAIIPSAVKSGPLNPMKVVNPARPAKQSTLFRNGKKVKQKPSNIANR